jgi:hypothetical protein
LGKPDCAVADRVFDDMRDEVETVFCKQGTVFFGHQTGMVELFAAELPYRFAVRPATGEDQRGPGGGVGVENRKHGPLVVRRQMKQAIPGQDSVETAAECKAAHVSAVPGVIREFLAAHGCHGGRRVDSGEACAVADQSAGDGVTGAAA